MNAVTGKFFWFRIIMDRNEREKYPHCPNKVSSEILEPYRKQIERNHGQTLERLNERGGMSPVEICLAAKYGGLEHLRKVKDDEAVKFLVKLNKGDVRRFLDIVEHEGRKVIKLKGGNIIEMNKDAHDVLEELRVLIHMEGIKKE